MDSQERSRRYQFAKKQADLLEAALLENTGVVVSVSTDGVNVTYSREQAYQELQRWRKEMYRYSEQGQRTRKIRIW